MEIEKVGNKFKIAILAAKRAKQIMKTGKKKIDIVAFNPLTVALEEIRQGLVTNETIIEDEKNSIIDLGETEVIEKRTESTDLEKKVSERLVSKDAPDENNENITDVERVKKNLTK